MRELLAHSKGGQMLQIANTLLKLNFWGTTRISHDIKQVLTIETSKTSPHQVRGVTGVALQCSCGNSNPSSPRICATGGPLTCLDQNKIKPPLCAGQEFISVARSGRDGYDIYRINYYEWMRWGTPSCRSKILTSCRHGWLLRASIIISESPDNSRLHSVIVFNFFAFLRKEASAFAIRGWPSRGGKSISNISSFGSSPIASKSWLLCSDDSFLKNGLFIRTCLQILWAENAWIKRVITSESSSSTSFCVNRPWGCGVLSFKLDDLDDLGDDDDGLGMVMLLLRDRWLKLCLRSSHERWVSMSTSCERISEDCVRRELKLVQWGR